MKNLRFNTLKNCAIFLFVFALSGLIFSACEKTEEGSISVRELSYELYNIGHEATTIIALNGSVVLEIPNNAINNGNTTLMISYGPAIPVDTQLLIGDRVFISLQGATLLKPIMVRLKYDPKELQCEDLSEEMCLKIYCSGSEDSGSEETNDQYEQYEYQYLFSGDQCKVDCCQKTVEAYFMSFGTLFIGKKK